MAKRPKKVRPKARNRKPTAGKRYPLNMRTTKEVREKLEAAAFESGRSLVQEVEKRIEESFYVENALNLLFGEASSMDEAVILRRYMQAIKYATGEAGEDPRNWWQYAMHAPFAFNPEEFFGKDTKAFDIESMTKPIRSEIDKFLRGIEADVKKNGPPLMQLEMYERLPGETKFDNRASREAARQYDYFRSLRILDNRSRRELNDDTLRKRFPKLFAGLVSARKMDLSSIPGLKLGGG